MIHIEDPTKNADYEGLVHTMLCGTECTIQPSGETSPVDFDFYQLGAGHEGATCAECLRVAKERTQ